MVPKTKIQKEVAKIYLKLKPVSEKQLQWASEKFTKFSLIQRNSFYCLECGHKEKLKDNSEILLMKITNRTTCPSCKAVAKPSVGTMPHNRQISSFKIFTTHKGQQVIRIIYGYKKLKRGAASETEYHEVMQHWISEKGDVVSLSKPKAFMSRYVDSFILYKDLEIRPSSFKYNDLFKTIDPIDLCPRYKILPTLKRNGFHLKALDTITPQELFPELLTNSYVETLIKAKQYSLLTAAVNNYPLSKKMAANRIAMNWPQIKIALRNKYNVSDAIVWLDYIDNLIKFNKDILSPKYICPTDLMHEHAKYLEKLKALRRKQKLKELIEKINDDNQEYLNKNKFFLDLYFKFENITIQTMQSVNQIFEEGDMLNHCVFENEYYKKENTLLLSAKVNNEVVETIEVNLAKFTIRQARGMSNQPSEHNSGIVKLVTENLKEIKKRYKKQIKQAA